MALVKKQSQTSRTTAIALVILILAGIGYFVYTKYIQNNDGTQNGNISATGTDVVKPDTKILDDKRATELKSYSVNINVDRSEGGQPYPFR